MPPSRVWYFVWILIVAIWIWLQFAVSEKVDDVCVLGHYSRELRYKELTTRETDRGKCIYHLFSDMGKRKSGADVFILHA